MSSTSYPVDGVGWKYATVPPTEAADESGDRLIAEHDNNARLVKSSSTLSFLRILLVVALLALVLLLTATDIYVRVVLLSSQLTRDLDQSLPHSLRTGPPVLSRNVYLLTCAGQQQMERYAALLATISVYADVVVYCWREECTLPATLLAASYTDHNASATTNSSRLSYLSPDALLVSPWPTMSHRFVRMRNGDIRSVDRFSTQLVFDARNASHGNTTATTPATATTATPTAGTISADHHYYPVHARFQLVNQNRLPRNLSWTGTRNYLYQHIHRLQVEQGWQWAYTTFMDGDVHPTCESVKRRLAGVNSSDSVHGSRQAAYLTQLNNALTLRPTALTSLLDAVRHNGTSDLVEKLKVPSVEATVPEEVCWLTYDSFLLSSSPAMASVSNFYSLTPNLYAEMGYHFDAMLASFHVDAAPMLLPYCEHFDKESWATSQAYMVTRGVCVFGHVVQFEELYLSAGDQSHSRYPNDGSPWELIKNWTLAIVPDDLLYLTFHLGQARLLSPVSLPHYSGFTRDVSLPYCVDGTIDPQSCLIIPHEQSDSTAGN